MTIKIRLSLFPIIISLIFCSCNSTFTARKSRAALAKTNNIYGAGVMHVPVIADLEVQETKVQGTATAIGDAEITDLHALAIADAVEKAEADMLIEPSFSYTKENGKQKVVVWGYPAKYKNFRSMTPADVEVMKAGNIGQPRVLYGQDDSDFVRETKKKRKN